LFEVSPLDWDAPDPALFDATILTSANAARCAGPKLRLYRELACYTVGEATAAAAREAGLHHVSHGESDAAALLKRVAQEGRKRILHLCGQDYIAEEHPSLSIERRMVYAAEALQDLPEEAGIALREHAVVLLHSPRAGRLFAELIDTAGLARGAISLAAISAAAADAAGTGWSRKAVSAYPRDEALLELAAKLCKTAGREETGTS
jgi:uroporphyrinogen-III synthase